MASPQHPATMEKLPNDVLLNIFIRLLAKQLAQMRCVSKPWNALLSQSSFVKSHLQRSIHNNDKILLVFYEGPSFLSKPFTAHRSESPNHELTEFIKLPAVPQSEFGYVGGRIVGSVNGLICFFYETQRDHVVHIWNPSLSADLTLPPSSISSAEYTSIECFYRFGFDPKTDDYNVVKLARLAGEWLQVEVFSMRKGSWDLITQSFPLNINIKTNNFEVCVDGIDGHVHWLGYFVDEPNSPIIVAFDLGVQTFREIPFPDSIQDENLCGRLNVLGVMYGKLCVMTAKYDDDGCEIWVMNEYGVADSWVKHHVFNGPVTHAYGFTSNGEFLYEVLQLCGNYETEYVGCLALCDLIVAEPKTFCHIHECIVVYISKIVVEYVDSLVWVVPEERKSNRCNTYLSANLKEAW